MTFDPCTIEPGDLRHFIQIQAPGTTRDATGQLNQTWTTVLSTFAAVKSTASLSFKFAFQGNVLASDSTDLITIRYPAVNIKPGYQVLAGSQTYVINAVDDTLRKHRVLQMAVVGQSVSSNY